jgi:hypothetical protein
MTLLPRLIVAGRHVVCQRILYLRLERVLRFPQWAWAALSMKADSLRNDARFTKHSFYKMKQSMMQQHHRNRWHVGNDHQRYEIQQQKR